MSTITNKLGLPAPLVDAISFSERDREGCDYTVSELLLPPRILALQRKHADSITEDASDRIWALIGSCGHEVLKRFAKAKGLGISEERAVIDVVIQGLKFKLGGQVDYADCGDKTIYDFKLVSIWSIKEGAKSEWIEQLNLYRFLLWNYGVEIDHLRLIAILRDWSVREARRDPEYPQVGVKVFDVPLWSWAECEIFIKQRIALHEAAWITLPECTAEETWEKPKKWAVMREGRQRAIRLHDNEADALVQSHETTNGYVEVRPGERPRCESYCACSRFCIQFLAWQSSQNK